MNKVDRADFCQKYLLNIKMFILFMILNYLNGLVLLPFTTVFYVVIKIKTK